MHQNMFNTYNGILIGLKFVLCIIHVPSRTRIVIISNNDKHHTTQEILGFSTGILLIKMV